MLRSNPSDLSRPLVAVGVGEFGKAVIAQVEASRRYYPQRHAAQPLFIQEQGWSLDGEKWGEPGTSDMPRIIREAMSLAVSRSGNGVSNPRGQVVVVITAHLQEAIGRAAWQVALTEIRKAALPAKPLFLFLLAFDSYACRSSLSQCLDLQS